jgi:hypothetical protein
MKLRLAFSLLPFVPGFALAQPSATMRPALLASGSFETSYSSREELSRRGQGLGRLAVHQYGVSVSGRRGLNDTTTLVYGLAFSSHELDAAGALPLPDRLAELTVNLGLQRRLSPQWSAAVYARPGFFGDFEELDGDSFNVPLLALANYTVSRELTWSFGVNINAFSDNPVLPVAGVRWQFAPDWTFSIGYPRAGFTWQSSPALAWRAGVSFQGGSFRVTENLGVPAPGIRRLANTLLDYREVRVGGGFDYTLGPGFTLGVDAGVVTDRKFDYIDRAYRLDGDLGFYGAISVQSRF